MSSIDVTKPHRAVEVDIHISANSDEDIVNELEMLLDDFQRRGVCPFVMAGGHASWRVEVAKDPSMTHEEYHAELKKYLAKTKAGKATTTKEST